MLTNHITKLPYSKLIVIQDSLKNDGQEFLKYFVNLHKTKVHYFIFERNFAMIQQSLLHLQNVQCHDFVSDFSGWFSEKKEFHTTLGCVNLNGSVIVIDSLIPVINQYGLAKVYELLHSLKVNTGVQRIVTMLHNDMLHNSEDICKYFEHLANLSIILTYSSLSNSRLTYMYKKHSGKVIKQVEDYTFLNGALKCTAIKKVDPNIIKHTASQVMPESLTTFRLTLNDNEKQARSQLILPYLPKDNVSETKDEILYKFDEMDDWDEEDPDDDLDI